MNESARRLALLLSLALAAALAPAAAGAQAHEHGSRTRAEKPAHRHPDARPGVTGERVLDAGIPERAHDAYAAARHSAAILDALYCHCDCHERDGKRSLLDCFEDRMAVTCGICLGQARLAAELHRKGRSLDEIRRAVDEAYGDRGAG